MRQPKPFFRKQTQSWYVQLGSKQIPLGKDEESAWQKYHAIMAKQAKQASTGSVTKCLDHYWQHISRELAATTVLRRKPILKSFGLYVGNLELSQLEPHHMLSWLRDSYPSASATYRHTLMTTIKAWSAWVVQCGYLAVDPLKSVKKPTPAVRQEFVPENRWPELLDHCGKPADPFRLLVEFLLQTGARAEEISRLTVENLDLEQLRFVFPIASSKGRRRSRTIYLSDRAVEIVKAILPEAGPIFVNSRGKPWTKNAINCRFRKLKAKMEMPWLCCTSLRHSFAHARLSRGQDGVTVSKLMGHCDTQMISRRYGHLEQNVEYMQQAARSGSSTKSAS